MNQLLLCHHRPLSRLVDKKYIIKDTWQGSNQLLPSNMISKTSFLLLHSPLFLLLYLEETNMSIVCSKLSKLSTELFDAIGKDIPTEGGIVEEN
jgi:hypothetical protein